MLDRTVEKYSIKDNECWNYYWEGINLTELKEYNNAIDKFNLFIELCDDIDDKALAYLNCGLLNAELGEYKLSIENFSNSILLETQLYSLNERSKCLSFDVRSESKYRNGDYKGAIEDKRKSKEIERAERLKRTKLKFRLDEFKNYSEQSMKKVLGIQHKFQVLIYLSKVVKSKYDLIQDYKKLLNSSRKKAIIKKLEHISDQRYQSGDYKGAIRAIRRSEKYY
tara:strand:+ start:331 stop:1002 length:672 start_codon:yes stop_codon:yes gene_type:complete